MCVPWDSVHTGKCSVHTSAKQHRSIFTLHHAALLLARHQLVPLATCMYTVPHCGYHAWHHGTGVRLPSYPTHATCTQRTVLAHLCEAPSAVQGCADTCNARKQRRTRHRDIQLVARAPTREREREREEMDREREGDRERAQT